MQIFQLIILGIVQGITEFLPVSSSGHLVLLGRWFGIEDNLFVSIILHVATLLAVVVCFRKEIWQMLRHPFGQDAVKLYVATIPTCLIVLVIMPLIDGVFEGKGLFLCFLFTALILYLTDRHSKKHQSGQAFSAKQAFVMGIAQGFAALPGVSRSGLTTSAGIFAGCDRKEVAKFSFIMSIPIIILSLILEILKMTLFHQSVNVNVPGICLAFVFAFIVGVASIKLMMEITQKAKFKWICLYLVVIALLSAIL